MQFLGGLPASLCMPVTLSWAWQEIPEGRGLVGWRKSATTVSLRNAHGFEVEVCSLLQVCWRREHLLWARPVLAAAAL